MNRSERRGKERKCSSCDTHINPDKNPERKGKCYFCAYGIKPKADEKLKEAKEV